LRSKVGRAKVQGTKVSLGTKGYEQNSSRDQTKVSRSKFRGMKVL
jgi:hypothetical protein